MSVLIELQEAVAAVAATAGPSVVGIGSRLRGSGVVIGDGRVLTNAHNLRGAEVTVRFAGGRTPRGTAAGVDWDGDLAVVEVDTARCARRRLGRRRAATIGSAVFAAAATSAGGIRVSFGFVSSVERAFRGPGGRRISGSLEHTAPLAPGSSGSALLDADGALVGLSTNRVGEGFYLALPADAGLRERVDALARGRVASAAAARHRGGARPCRPPAPPVRGPARSATACWSGAWRPGRRPRRAGIAEGDLLVAAGGPAGGRRGRPPRGPARRRAPARGDPGPRRRGADGHGGRRGAGARRGVAPGPRLGPGGQGIRTAFGWAGAHRRATRGSSVDATSRAAGIHRRTNWTARTRTPPTASRRASRDPNSPRRPMPGEFAPHHGPAARPPVLGGALEDQDGRAAQDRRPASTGSPPSTRPAGTRSCSSPTTSTSTSSPTPARPP